MELSYTPVSRCLDKKMMILGFEVLDILAIFLTLSILNFLFGRTALKPFFVWLPSVSLAAILKYGKRGKPENYLLHWLRFQIRPGVLKAFSDAEEQVTKKWKVA